MQGQTEISMLHPRCMQLLYPHPVVEKASMTAAPLLTDMLESVAKKTLVADWEESNDHSSSME